MNEVASEKYSVKQVLFAFLISKICSWLMPLRSCTITGEYWSYHRDILSEVLLSMVLVAHGEPHQIKNS